MSVTLVNASLLTTAANSVIGVGKNKASMAFFFRVNADVPMTWTNGFNGMCGVQRSNGQGLGMTAYGVDEPNQVLTILFVWRTAAGGVSGTYKFFPGVVYLIAMTYDKDDSTKQILNVNGVPIPLTGTQNQPLLATTNSVMLGTTQSGTYNRSWTISKLQFWNDYVLSTPEILSIMDGSGDITTIGTSASWRGYWTMDGTTGATVNNGDAGIGNSIDGSWPFTKALNAAVPGTAIVYSDPMPFVSQSGYDTPVVGSSGKTIAFAAKVAATGNAIAVTAGSAVIMPTIKINGGSPITLESPFYNTSQHEGICYNLPSGYKINRNDVVTFSVATGWFATSLGVAKGTTDLPLINKADGPKYDYLGYKDLRVGFNYTFPGSTYYSQEQGPKNYALRMLVDNSINPPHAVRADGTLMQNFSGTLNGTAFGNGIDKSSYPMTLGKWVISWDDVDPTKPNNIYLDGSIAGVCTELTDYRNNGDVNGVGRAKVFDFQLKVWPIALAVGCSPTDTVLTLDTVNGLVINGQMWAKFEDEYMEVSNVNTTLKQITVIRGVMNSSAVAHASGTAGGSSWYRRNPGVNVYVFGPTGNVPNYKNLVIYGPQDWTPPSPAAPVVIDRTAGNRLAPSKFIRDSLSGGIGLVRHMDSCGTFMCTAEPEDHRLDSDLYWGQDIKTTIKFKVATLDQPPPSFYIYSHIPDGETYTATLGAAITTAPARDTVEVITISDAATAPVMAGSRIKIDNEWVRVLDVNGTTCTVVRGARSTTPATHANGTVCTVGWRIPITNTGQYRQVTTVHVMATTATPHKLRSGMWAENPKALDLNPMARFPVTLTAQPVVGSKVVKISADPSKWQYIARDLYLKFDNEEMIVVTADQSTGTVTVKAAIAAVHTSGTVGSTYAAGVFCVSEDGVDYSWSQHQTNNAYWVTGPNTLLIPLYAYVGNANKIPVMVGAEQYWDTTPVMVSGEDTKNFIWKLPHAVYSFEYSARVTALSPGAWHWLNIPIIASDDLVDWIARKIRDGLPAGKHKVIVELSNEIWNYYFPFIVPIFGFSQMLGYTGSTTAWIKWWILRTKAVFQRVVDVFNEDGRNRGSEVLLSLPYQAGQLGDALVIARASGVDIDVASSACYVTPGATPSHITAFRNADDEQAGDIWLFDLEYWNGGQGSRMRLDKKALQTHRSLTNNRPMTLLCYEGGVSSAMTVPTTGMNDQTILPDGIERNRDMLYNPNWYNIDRDYYRVLKRIGDADGVALFNHCQPPGRLPAGAGYYDEMWGVLCWHGQQAGRGDGSDGKFDNRTNLYRPGQTKSRSPIINPEETNVSVRMQSIIDHNIAFFSDPDPT